MENRPNLPDQSMMSAMALLETLNMSMSVDTFLEFAAFAFTRVRPQCVTTKMKIEVADGGVVELPVDMDYIKAVSSLVNTWDDWKVEQILNISNTKIVDSEDGVRSDGSFGEMKTDYSNTDLRVLGEYIDFKREGKSTLYVSPDLVNSYVYILGLAPLMDVENLPLLTLKQVEALAYQVAVMYAQKQMFSGCNQYDINYLTQLATKRTAQSRVPDYISDNEWNEILDVRHSHDRKVFNKDFKFRK